MSDTTKAISLDNMSTFLTNVRGEYATKTDVGTKTNLQTTEKGTLVGAINELKSSVDEFESAKTDIGNAIVAKGGTVSGSISTYAQSIANLPSGSGDGLKSTIRGSGCHVDSDGVWHKPDEWYDIESLSISTPVVYLLYDCTLVAQPFASLRIYAQSTITVVAYNVVGDDDKTLETIETKTLSSGGYYRKYLGSYDQVVLKVTCADGRLNSVSPAAWSATSDLNCSMTAANQPCVMRYGYAPYFNSPVFSCIWLESENVKNVGELFVVGSTKYSWANCYASNRNMQRIRFTGWRVDRLPINNFSAFLSACEVLSDVDETIDMTGWVGQYCTTVTNMFSGCLVLRAKLNCSNWNFAACTTIANLFYNCSLVSEIIGTDTWTNGTAITTCGNAFYGCQSLKGELNLSGMNLGGNNKLTATNGMFYYCYALNKINLSNTNFSKATNISGMFYCTYSLKELVTNNITNITSTCTDAKQLFQYSGLPEIIIDGIDFSGLTSYNYYGLVAYSYAKKASITNCLSPASYPDTNATYSTVSRYSRQMTYLDASSFDMSRSTGTQISLVGFRNMDCLVEFYPPQNIKTAFYMGDSPNLSHDSIMRIINNLATVTTTQKLTLGSYNLTKISTAEKAVATGKGWTLA